MNRRNFLKASAGAALFSRAGFSQTPKRPNIVLILADDLGYGDLSCYGSDISTPNIDSMADTGVKFNHFYSASPVCSPSRAALLTGRYQTRVGVPGVLGPQANDGLALRETTLPQVLKSANYMSMCIGKWHLGAGPGYMPLDRGFDQFYGLPYSNDMSPLPLYDGTAVVEAQAQLSSLTARYTDKAVDFINTNAGAKPFFLYMAHTFPHIPLAASDRFKGKSGKGLYGDCIQELDWSTGQIMDALKSSGVSNNTLVIFTSDNGPWYQGSPGRLRGRKAETFEGGMREPFLARWPGRIPPGRTVASSMATMMDLFPTFAKLAGATVMPDAPLDGVDIMPMMTGDADAVDRDPFFYFDDCNLQCVRQGRWKLHVARYNTPPWIPQPPEGRINLPLMNPELYDVVADPQESYDVAAEHPEIVWPLRAKIDAAIRTFPGEVQRSWADTLSHLVNGSPSGAWPVCPPN